MNKAVIIKADAAKLAGNLPHNWNYIGYDECNYTHSPGGMELLKKFGALENKPYYVRAHHMLCTGICHGEYKWGSTNAYTEDENGNPIYDFSVIDKMCDIWLNSNCKPFFEIGFMPMDLVDLSDTGYKGNQLFREYKRNGWNRPPKDYGKWYNLIRALITHLLSCYGQTELESWYFEMWNEADIPYYWRGSHEEFCKLYDYTEAAVHDACPSLRFGGPASRGAPELDSKEAIFLRDFLKHTRSGKNFKTGKTGTRLDFTSVHTKGANYYYSAEKELERTPSIKVLLNKIRNCMTIIKEYGYGDLECVLSEIDPDGWAAGGRFDNPAFNFRNTEYYASYVASSYKNLHKLALELNMDIRPMAWAFMFEGERCFEGTRVFSTQGIDKAVFNVFKLFPKLGNQLVELSSTASREPEKYKDNWGEGAEIDGWATLTEAKSLEVFLYCHEDTWETGVYPVKFTAENLPFNGECKISRYLIDKDHSNAYAEWLNQGQPDWPQGRQYEAIKARSGLELAEPQRSLFVTDGKFELSFELSLKSVSLLVIEKIRG